MQQQQGFYKNILMRYLKTQASYINFYTDCNEVF